jgi:hypothetical protein
VIADADDGWIGDFERCKGFCPYDFMPLASVYEDLEEMPK